MTADGDEHVRGVRPRWPAVTRTTVPRPSDRMLPALVSDVRDARPGREAVRSQRHLELVAELRDTDVHSPWPTRALHACLNHLLTSTVTEAARAWIIDAWAERDDAVCVVYRPPHDEGRVVGLRRCRRDALEPSDWRIGDMTTWGYDMGADIDPERFGWNVADFDVGEPLGYVTTVLRYDSADIGWWGGLGSELPTPPH